MKGFIKNAVLFLHTVGIMLLTIIGASADPIGGWAKSRNSKTIPMDSPLGIGILVAIGVFLLFIFLLVIRKMRRK